MPHWHQRHQLGPLWWPPGGLLPSLRLLQTRFVPLRARCDVARPRPPVRGSTETLDRMKDSHSNSQHARRHVDRATEASRRPAAGSAPPSTWPAGPRRDRGNRGRRAAAPQLIRGQRVGGQRALSPNLGGAKLESQRTLPAGQRPARACPGWLIEQT